MPGHLAFSREMAAAAIPIRHPRPGWGGATVAVTTAVAVAAAMAFILPIAGCDGCGGPRSTRVHLLFTGVSKGNIVPYICRFAPYKDLKMGGAAYAAGLVRDVRGQHAGDGLLVLSIGSELSGTPEAYFTQGKAVIEALDSYRLDAMLVGNIEFSFGRNQLAELAKLARFPMLSSNLREVSTGEPPPFVKREVVIKTANGISVAVLGLSPTRTPAMVMRDSIEGLEFLPPQTWLGERVAAHRTAGAHLVVLLTLYDRDRFEPEEWAAIKAARPDVVTMMGFETVASNPVTANLQDGILVQAVNGYNQGKEFNLLSLELTPDLKGIATFQSQVLPVDCAKLSPDPDTAARINRAVAKIDMIKSQRICDLASDVHKVYYGECPIGNLVAEAMRDYFRAEVGLQNSGGIQADLRGGRVTLGDLYNVLPFDNQVIAMDLSGADLQEILTVAASLKRGVLQISGAAYTFANWSVDRFEMRSITVGGEPLVATRTYRVSTNSFLVQGGDEFRAFKRGRNLDIGPTQREVVSQYLQRLAASGTVTLGVDGRIQRAED